MARTSKQHRPRPALLLILEGLGIAPASENNLLTTVETPYLKHLITHYPVAALRSCGDDIAIKEPSSRLGHIVIGTGRQYPNCAHIVGEAMKENSLLAFEGFRELKKELQTGRVHLEVFLSHSEEEYSSQLVENFLTWLQEQGDPAVYIHAVLDGRSSSPTSGQRLVMELEKIIDKFPKATLASLIGRWYAFDNKHNSGRLKKTFSLWTGGKGNTAETGTAALAASYEKKIFDEEFAATILPGFAPVVAGDSIVLLNYCSEHLRGLIEYFERQKFNCHFWTLTDSIRLANVKPLIPGGIMSHTLGEVIAENGLRQLRISDSLGFAAVSSFLDGGKLLEKHIVKTLIPTQAGEPLSTAIDNIQDLSKELIKAIEEGGYDFIATTFSYLDLMAHRGNIEQASEILEKLDSRLKLVVEAVLEKGGVVFITSSHGFIEQARNAATDEAVHTHSRNFVPFCVVGKQFEGYNLGWPEAPGGDLSVLPAIGTLADIAPTILSVLRLDAPAEMTGENLIN